MNLYGLPQLISSIIIFFIALLIHIYNKKNAVNTTFALFCFAVFVYIFGIFMVYQSKNETEALFWQTFIQYGVILIPVFLYHSFSSFSTGKNLSVKIKIIAGYLISSLFMILNSFGLIITKNLRFDNKYHFYYPSKMNIFFIFFMAYFFVFILFSVVELIRLIRQDRNPFNRSKYKYLLTMLLISLFGVIDYIPFVIKTTWYPYGSIFTTIGVVFVGYIFLKFNIDRYNLIIKKYILISSLYVFVFGSYFLILYSIMDAFKARPDVFPVFLFTTPLFLILIAYEKIRKPISNFIYKIFFYRQYNYRKTLIDFNESLIDLSEENDILNRTQKKITELFRVEFCTIYTIENGIIHQEKQFLYYTQNREKILMAPEIRDYLIKKKESVTQESFDRKLQLDFQEKNVYRFLQTINADLCVPIIRNNKLLGIINIGKRESGAIFESTDKSLLFMTGLFLGKALANARRMEAQKERENEKKAKLLEELHRIRLEKPFRHIITQSLSMVEIFQGVREIANKNITVLIYGESGTGKELISRAIHMAGQRSGKAFIAINCAAIPAELLESELFGHERGAFTGAHATHKGKIEKAAGGTLFLDEIGELDLKLQAKLLRFLQEKEITRLGSNKTIKADARIIAATNRDLEDMVANKLFREDLYYRITAFRINLPSLRERKEDIRLLVRHFLVEFSRENNMSFPKISEKALSRLEQYNYPGNIRELQNIVYQLIFKIKNKTMIEDGDIPEFQNNHSLRSGLQSIRGFKEAVEQYEKEILLEAMETCSHNQRKTAELLKMSPQSLQYKLKKYQID